MLYNNNRRSVPDNIAHLKMNLNNFQQQHQQQQQQQQQQLQQQQDLTMVAASVNNATTAVSTFSFSTSQYKMKSKMMNKFFNDPVEALDLRLGRAEDNIKSVEAWLANPLTEVKQELFPPSPAEVKVECPLDYSEVQVATPPTPPAISADRSPLQPQLSSAAASFCSKSISSSSFRFPLSPTSGGGLGGHHGDRQVTMTGLLPQRVILNPANQQETATCRQSPSPGGRSGRFSPYPPGRPIIRRPSYIQQTVALSPTTLAQEDCVARSPWAATSQRMPTPSAAMTSPGFPAGGGGGGVYPSPTGLQTAKPRTFHPDQLSPCREYGGVGGGGISRPHYSSHNPSSSSSPLLSQLSPLHPALHGLNSNSTTSLPYHSGQRHLSGGYFHRNEDDINAASSFAAGVSSPQRADNPSSRQPSMYLHDGGGRNPQYLGVGSPPDHPSPSSLGQTTSKERSYIFNPPHPNSGSNSNSMMSRYWGPLHQSQGRHGFADGSSNSRRLDGPASLEGSDQLLPLTVIKMEAEEENVTRISFSEHSAYGTMRHASGSGSPPDTKPLPGDPINMDDKIALAENMMSTFNNGNPLMLSIPSAGGSTASRSEAGGLLEEAKSSGGGLLHAAPPTQLSPHEQERLAAPTYYSNRGGGQTPGLNPFWGMRGPRPPSGHHHHPHHNPQYLRSCELMQDYAAVQVAVAAAAAAQAAQSCRRDLGWGSTSSSLSQAGTPRAAGAEASVRQSSVIVRAEKQNAAVKPTTSPYHPHCEDEESQRLVHSQRQQRMTAAAAEMSAANLHNQQPHILPDSSKHQQLNNSGNNSFLLSLSPKDRELHKSWLSLQSARMCSLVQHAATTDRGSVPPERIKLEEGLTAGGGHPRPSGLHKFPNPGYLGHHHQQQPTPSFPGLKPASTPSFPGLKPYDRYDERTGTTAVGLQRTGTTAVGLQRPCTTAVGLQRPGTTSAGLQRQLKEERKSKMANRMVKVVPFSPFSKSVSFINLSLSFWPTCMSVNTFLQSSIVHNLQPWSLCWNDNWQPAVERGWHPGKNCFIRSLQQYVKRNLCNL